MTAPTSSATPTPKGFKGLVLAAGYGSRMAPLTEVTPKPLLPFFTSTIIEFALDKLEPYCAGLTVNSFHLKERMISYFEQYHGEKIKDQRIQLFLEDELLGTGGTIASLKDWLGDDDLIVYNSDIYSNVNMQAVIDHHRRDQAAATMVLLPRPIAGKTVIYRNDNGIMAIGGQPPVHSDQAGHSGDQVGDQVGEHLFTGIHILSNRFVKTMPDIKPYQVVDQYKDYLGQKEKIAGYIYAGPWYDIGEPQHFFQAIEQLTTTYKDQLSATLAALKASGRMRHPYTKSAGGQRQGEQQKVYCFGEQPAGLAGETASHCVFLGGNTPIAAGTRYGNALYLADKVLPFTPIA